MCKLWGLHTKLQFECLSSNSPLKKKTARLRRRKTTLCCNKQPFVFCDLLYMWNRMNGMTLNNQMLRLKKQLKQKWKCCHYLLARLSVKHCSLVSIFTEITFDNSKMYTMQTVTVREILTVKATSVNIHIFIWPQQKESGWIYLEILCPSLGTLGHN